MTNPRNLGSLTAVFCLLATTLWSQEFSAQQLEFFESKIRPLLVDHCYECHGLEADPPEGGLSLASRSSILAGGDSGPAIDLDEINDSLLLDAVEYGDLFQMPPDSQLSTEQIAAIRKWVEMGAPWPAESDHAAATAALFDWQKRRDEHWCWHVAAKPPRPPVLNRQWPRDELDYFVLAKLEQAGLQPARAADRRTWLRRVYFDLIGLPPSPDQLQAFATDPSQRAFEKVVDQLLASPHFGERWARHWMDLIRYAETCGHEFEYPIPHAFRYRDYLIRALNADVPYDQFVKEHIAGDLLPTPRLHEKELYNESVLGTGFWFLGEATHAPVDVKGNEAGHIDNQIDIMSKTFLGITVACARCHDHKFDAISTEDYYALAGFLQSSRRQEVMLDPGRKIEKSFEQAQDLVSAANRALSHAAGPYNRIVQLEMSRNSNHMSGYLQAAVKFLQTERSWLLPESVLIEAESLQTIDQNAGKVDIQAIPDRGQYKWSGGKQLRWAGAEIGDAIDLDLEVPEHGEYSLSADFKTAPNCAIVQLALDGENLGEPIDLYTPEPQKTGERDLGTLTLRAGKHRLRLTLAGANAEAKPRHLVGVDYFRLRPASDEQTLAKRRTVLQQLALEHGLEAYLVSNWVAALKDDATKEISHPFYLLRKSAESELDLSSNEADEFYSKLWRQLDREFAKAAQWRESTVEFADFEPGSYGDWFETGVAFGSTIARKAHAQSRRRFDPSPLGPFTSSGVAHSGIYGSHFNGVLRSPTFEITHPYIHYRIAGENAQVRLIIDGYVMDVYNPLLFNGMSFKVNTGGKYRWHTQGQDLKKYLGHRAYIEIIDQGKGFVAVDEIRFSSQPQTADFPITRFALDNAPRTLENPQDGTGRSRLERVADALAYHLSEELLPDRNPPSDLQARLQNFFARHRLWPDAQSDEAWERIAGIRSRLDELDKATPQPMLAVGITDGTAENEYVFIRGNHRNLGQEAARRPPAALAGESWTVVDAGSGRLQLAEHIAFEDNPLTARVFVNRIWHHLTGQGIVPSVDNFGMLGQEATHPQLLDYLATEFSDDGWSLKRMIRRIVLSETYRMASTANPAAAAAEPNNNLLHHFRIRRLPGEAIRDSILSVSGELDTKMYGPSIPVYLTPFMDGRGKPGKSGPLDGAARRSVYQEIRRNFLPPMMLAFDMPIPFNTMGRRNISNVPAQALIMMNDPFVVDQSKKWARRIVQDDLSIERRIDQMFTTALGRPPAASELEQTQTFLVNQAKEMGIAEAEISSSEALWADLCHVVFNMKEFIYLQ